MSSVLLAPLILGNPRFSDGLRPAFLHGETTMFPRPPSRKRCSNKNTPFGVFLCRLFFTLLMSSVLLAPLTILVELNFTLNEFFILC